MACVSEQITDAITQTNVKVVAESPAYALGTSYLSAAHSSGMMYHTAVHAQGQQYIQAQAANTQGVLQILSMDTMSNAIGIARMLQASENA